MVLVQLFIDMYWFFMTDCNVVIFKRFLGSHILISDMNLFYILKRLTVYGVVHEML